MRIVVDGAAVEDEAPGAAGVVMTPPAAVMMAAEGAAPGFPAQPLLTLPTPGAVSGVCEAMRLLYEVASVVAGAAPLVVMV